MQVSAVRNASGLGDAVDAFAQRAIADLIVVLRERHERGRRQHRARLAARRAVTERRRLALVDEALRECASRSDAADDPCSRRSSRRARR